MKYWLALICIFSAVAMTSACRSVVRTSCSFDISQDVWVRVPSDIEDQITPIELEESRWYRHRESGDYLICSNPISEWVCGGIYETFTKGEEGRYERDYVVCLN